MSRIIIARPDGTDELEVDQTTFNNGFFPGYVYVRAASGSPSNPLAVLDADMAAVQANSASTFSKQLGAAYVSRRIVPLYGPAFTKMVTVMVYHVVQSLSWFQSECDYFQKWNYTTITCADIDAFLDGTGSLPEKPLLITFDDGYASQYQAAQELNARGMKGTWYVATNWIDGTETQAQGNFLEATPLTWTQLNQMKAWGMDIQSHTAQHQDQTTLTTTQVVNEWLTSKARIEAQVPGQTVTHMAYPYGAWSTAVQDALAANGCLTARTVAVNPDGTFPGANQGYNDFVTPFSDRYAFPTSGSSAVYVQPHNQHGLLAPNAELCWDSNWLLGDSTRNGWALDAAFSYTTADKAPVTTPTQVRSLTALNPAVTSTAKGQLIPVPRYASLTMRVWVKTSGAPTNGVRFYLEGRKSDNSTIDGAVPYTGQQVQLSGTNAWAQYSFSVQGDSLLYGVMPTLYAAAGTYQVWFGPVSVRRTHLQHGWPMI